MRGLKPNTFTAMSWVLAAGLAGAMPGYAEEMPEAARDGIAYYNEEAYNQAVQKFQEAQSEKPDHPQVAYNAGNANYRLGRYETALENYGKVVSESNDPDLKQKAWYNKGNAYYKLGMLDKAIEAYKKSLELNPKDEDSKFNYEYTKKQLEKAIASGQIMPRNLDELKKQQAQKGQAPPQPSESSSEEGQAAEHPDAPEPPEDTQTAEQEKNQPDRKGKDKPEPETMPQPKPPAPSTAEQRKMQQLLHDAVPMTREEAERLLGSLNENLKKYKHRQMQGEMKDLFKEQGKDW